jgi:hypothetical protein
MGNATALGVLMPDVFISYSAQDEKLARWLYKSCENLNISAFLASISLEPGSRWKKEIQNNLLAAKWFFFLATQNSIKSDPVKHEIGGALTLNKKIIPILYGIDFEDLPEWIKEYQGVKIANTDTSELIRTLKAVSKKIKVDDLMTGLLIGAFIGLLVLAAKE